MQKSTIIVISVLGGIFFILFAIFIFAMGISSFKATGDKIALIEISGINK